MLVPPLLSHPLSFLIRLQVQVQIEWQGPWEENICRHSLLSTGRIHNEGIYIWKVRRVDANKSWGTKPKEADPRATEELCPLRWVPLGFFLAHSPSHTFPLPAFLQHTPPTTVNSTASHQNVTSFGETEPQLPLFQMGIITPTSWGSSEDKKTVGEKVFWRKIAPFTANGWFYFTLFYFCN